MPGACMASMGSGAMGSALAVPVIPKSSAAVEPTATAALANSLRVDDIVLPRLEVMWLLRGHGRALRTPAGSRPAAAGAAAAGAAAGGGGAGGAGAGGGAASGAAARGASGAVAVSGAVASGAVAAAGAAAAGAVRPGSERPV